MVNDRTHRDYPVHHCFSIAVLFKRISGCMFLRRCLPVRNVRGFSFVIRLMKRRKQIRRQTDFGIERRQDQRRKEPRPTTHERTTTLHCSECGAEYHTDGQEFCSECGGEMTDACDG